MWDRGVQRVCPRCGNTNFFYVQAKEYHVYLIRQLPEAPGEFDFLDDTETAEAETLWDSLTCEQCGYEGCEDDFIDEEGEDYYHALSILSEYVEVE